MQYLLGLYEKAMPAALLWDDKLASAREGGFDYLEISVDESDEKLARLDQRETWLAIRKAAEVAACPVKSMCLSAHRKYPLGSADKATSAQSLSIMGKAIEMASFLGIRVIQLAGYDVYYSQSTPQTRAIFSDNLAVATGMAASQGVMLGFETMETAFMDTIAKAMHYVREINSPYLQIYPDLGNLTNAAKLYEHDLHADIELGRGHIAAAHLKETKPGHYREVPFGTGHVDFTSAAEAFLRQGVRMFVGEFWHVGSLDWKKDLKYASTFLRGHIDAAVKKIA